MKKYGRWTTHVVWGMVLLAVLVAGGIAVSMVFGRISYFEEQITERDIVIAEMAAQWEELGPTVEGLVLIRGVRGGQEVRPDNWNEFFQVVTYPESLNLHVASPDDFTTVKYIRASMQEGTVLTQDDILDTRMEDSLRYYDIILDEYPVGLLEGKYIDIRVRFPFGQDFIAISHKRVEQLNGSVIKLVLSEQDIYTYNSMLTDKIMYQAQLYAVEYIDTGSQQAASQFYPLNYNQQELLLKNPNALDIVRQEMRLSRELLESEMLDIEPADTAQKQQHYLQLQQQLASLRSANSGAISGQQALFIARWEAEQRAAAAGEEVGSGNADLSWEEYGPVR